MGQILRSNCTTLITISGAAGNQSLELTQHVYLHYLSPFHYVGWHSALLYLLINGEVQCLVWMLLLVLRVFLYKYIYESIT